MMRASWQGRKCASKVPMKPLPSPLNAFTIPPASSVPWPVFSYLRPILETTCKSSREDRLLLLCMLVGDEYSFDRRTEQLTRLSLG